MKSQVHLLTDKERERIKQMRDDGYTHKTIAHRVDVEVSVVKKLCIATPIKCGSRTDTEINADTELRVCTRCKTAKPLTAFRNHFSWSLKQCSDCRMHKTAYRKALTPRKPGETTTERQLRQSSANHYLEIREHGLITKYGLTLEDIQAMLVASEYKCAICRRSISLTQTTLEHKSRADVACVDHCHTTGRVRGLLCGRCNLGIGCFLESKEALRNAIKYLKKHNK